MSDEEYLEQIRQVEEQWTLIGAQSIEWYRNMEREGAWTNRRQFWARGFIQFQMVLGRLEAIRDDLKKGMRI